MIFEERAEARWLMRLLTEQIAKSYCNYKCHLASIIIFIWSLSSSSPKLSLKSLSSVATYLGPSRDFHFHLYHLHLIFVIWSSSSLSSDHYHPPYQNHHPRCRPRTAVHLSRALEGLAALPMLHSCALVYTGPYCSAECFTAVQCNILIPYTTLQCTAIKSTSMH